MGVIRATSLVTVGEKKIKTKQTKSVVVASAELVDIQWQVRVWVSMYNLPQRPLLAGALREPFFVVPWRWAFFGRFGCFAFS